MVSVLGFLGTSLLGFSGINELFAQIINGFVLIAVFHNIVDNGDDLFNGLIQKEFGDNGVVIGAQNEMGELQIAHNLLGNGLEDRLLLGVGGKNNLFGGKNSLFGGKNNLFGGVENSLFGGVENGVSVGNHFVKGLRKLGLVLVLG
jgi:hypothetical protein